MTLVVFRYLPSNGPHTRSWGSASAISACFYRWQTDLLKWEPSLLSSHNLTPERKMVAVFSTLYHGYTNFVYVYLFFIGQYILFVIYTRVIISRNIKCHEYIGSLENINCCKTVPRIVMVKLKCHK